MDAVCQKAVYCLGFRYCSDDFGEKTGILGQKNGRIIFSAIILRENQHEDMWAQKINAFKNTRMFCVWKINHLCWGVTAGTHEEISSSCENRIAQTQTSKDLLVTSTAEGLGRKAILREAVDAGLCQQMEASLLSGDGLLCRERKAKAFLSPSAHSLPELAPSSPGPFHHPSIKLFHKLFNFAPSLIHGGRQSMTTFSYAVSSSVKILCN